MKLTHETIGRYDPKTGDIVYSLVRHRVGQCPYCDRLRACRISDEFIRRVVASGLEVSRLHLWSLGCSLRDSGANRRLLGRWWREFTEKMKRTYWVPCFRLMEVGRRGYLHFHVVVYGYVEHSLMLEAWRSCTGEASNVNVSGFRGKAGDLVGLAKYLTKYLTKEGTCISRSYRWLGPLYRIPRIPCLPGKSSFLYGGITCYFGPSVDEYPPKEVQRKID